MSLDPNDGRKPTIQVADAIRRDILAGVLPRGERIPSAPDLAGKYGVSKQTVTNAVKRLQESGFVVTRVGDGTYVRTDIVEERLAEPIGASTASAEYLALSRRVDGLEGTIREIIEQLARIEDRLPDTPNRPE